MEGKQLLPWNSKIEKDRRAPNFASTTQSTPSLSTSIPWLVSFILTATLKSPNRTSIPTGNLFQRNLVTPFGAAAVSGFRDYISGTLDFGRPVFLQIHIDEYFFQPGPLHGDKPPIYDESSPEVDCHILVVH